MDFEKGQTGTDAECPAPGLQLAMEQLPPRVPVSTSKWPSLSRSIPKTTAERLHRAPHECALIVEGGRQLTPADEETVLYLGYGSNLAAKTFLGRRGIRPLSQVNVVVPSIQLTFDLPGLPYSEPCFANTRYRPQPDDPPEPERPPYHKNAWKKGLVGVVYEVTKEDYAHIIATEGGGSGYHDILVDCYVLDDDASKDVPLEPSGTPFKAHTLYAHDAEFLRANPGYAQPSPRYLGLIRDGAEEHDLPKEYRYFLENIRTYRATTTKQRLGSFIFLAVWGPIFAFVFGGAAKVFLRKDGTYPPWFARLTAAIFRATWASYDNWFFPLFGDGERTIGDDLPGKMSQHNSNSLAKPYQSEQKDLSERTPLLL